MIFGETFFLPQSGGCGFPNAKSDEHPNPFKRKIHFSSLLLLVFQRPCPKPLVFDHIVMSSVVFAAAPYVYLSSERDADYVRILAEAIQNVAQLPSGQGGIGPRAALALVPESDLLARLAYYYSTYCLNSRTLGQEICDSLPVHVDFSNGSPRPALLSDGRRLALVLLHSLGPYLQERFRPLAILGEAPATPGPRREGSSAQPSRRGMARQRRPLGWLVDPLITAARNLPAAEIIAHLRRLHTCIFYFTGRYYEFALRLVGASLVRPSAAPQSQSRYKALGVLLSMELVGGALRRAAQEWRRRAAASASPAAAPRGTSRARPVRHPALADDSSVENRPALAEQATEPDHAAEGPSGAGGRCVLCMGPRSKTSATECGHLFCWDCIVGWCLSAGAAAECPLCRQRIEAQRILLLPWS